MACRGSPRGNKERISAFRCVCEGRVARLILWDREGVGVGDG